MKFNFKVISIFCFVIFFKSFAISAPPEKSPKKWPCDQVYNPKLDLKALWQGPDLNDSVKNWWKDDDVIEVVTELSDPVLSEEDGKKIIEDFAEEYTYLGLIKKKEQKIKLINLFSGLYQKAASKRNRQYVGIIKFVERQDTIRKAIGTSSKKLRELRKSKVANDDPEFVRYESMLKWNTRVFDQRTRLTEYICEEPVFLEQRVGYQARKILSYLKK